MHCRRNYNDSAFFRKVWLVAIVRRRDFGRDWIGRNMALEYRFSMLFGFCLRTKELYDISSKKGMLEEATGVFYIIQNVKKNEYASNIVDDGVASSPNIDDAMLFDTKQEAERVVHDFGLSKNDGWFVKQAKI